jgi:hypothetical protein
VRPLTEKETRFLQSYHDLVEQGWAGWSRPPSLSVSDWWRLAWHEDKVQELVADWADWMKERAKRDGLQLETRIVYLYNRYILECSYWAGFARLLGPGGETLEQIPFTRHRQGHYSSVDRDPDAELRQREALVTLYGPTLAAARCRLADELGPSTGVERASS